MSGFNVRYIEPLSLDEIYRLGYQQHLKEQQSFSNSFRLNIEKLRLTFRQILNSSSLQQKGLILALLTGDESLLSDETQLQFKQLGISHLLAIYVLILPLCYLGHVINLSVVIILKFTYGNRNRF